MARKPDPLSDSFGIDDSDNWLGGLVADEDDLDRHTLWRLGLWGFAAVGALTLGILSGQLPVNAQRTQLATSEFAGRAKHVESSVHETQLEARRLAAAVETLNGDRDRLFTRLSTLEQGLDVVTGSIKKTDDRPASAPWPVAATPPIVEAVPPTIAIPLSAPPAPSIATASPIEPERPPTVVAARTDQPAAEGPPPVPSVVQALPIPDAVTAPPDAGEKPAEGSAVALANFGIDLGAANSINGLRALWRGLIKSHKVQLEGMRPLIAVRERRNGLGLQLRLIAGPIRDAAAAAQVCAVLSDADRDCKTTAFDGQRLSLATAPEQRTDPPRPAKQRKSSRSQPEASQAKPAESSSFTTMLGLR